MSGELPEVLSKAIRNRLAEVHTSMPGRIESYDHRTKKATVKPLINRVYPDGRVDEFPVLNAVPVLLPGTSTGALQFRIRRGTPVALYFSERSMDLWKSQGGLVAPDDRRRFSLSDAFCVPGLDAFDGGFYPEDNDKTRLVESGGALAIDGRGRVALGNADGELLDMVQQLMQLLIDARVLTSIGTQPLTNAAQIADLREQLNNIRGSL
jgi:hypothetical protein